MFIVAEICAGRAQAFHRYTVYPLWACLLRESHDSCALNKADRQVETDRQAEIDSVMRTTEQNPGAPPPHASLSLMISCLIDFIYLTRGSVAV